MELDEFNRKFPNKQACLLYLFIKRFNKPICPKCKRTNQYHEQKETSHFICTCGKHQLSPKKDTIFEKSNTDLYRWFYILFLFSKTKNGLTAKEIQKHIQCTYKTAWRIRYQINMMLKRNNVSPTDIIQGNDLYLG